MEPISNKIESFFNNYTLRSYKKGQVLLLNGDKANHVFHLLEGRVKQYDITYRGDEIILNIFKPPAFFPMSLVINDTTNLYTYEADSDIKLRQAPAEDVMQFLKDNPDVLMDLLSRVYRGADGMIGRLAQLMAGSAKSRLIYEIILEARRFGVADKDGPGCTLSMSEKDLGAHAGLTRETVSREITKLKKDGLIDIERKGIYITDMKALEKKLGQVV